MRNFDRLRRYTSELARMLLDSLYAYKGRNIERCLLMVGYRRSGASLLGQLLNSGQAGKVSLTAIDDTGERSKPVTLSHGSGGAVGFNSPDMEQGIAVKGLPGGVDDGGGSWRLVLERDLSIPPLAYIRTSGGFVAGMHIAAPETHRTT